MRALVFPTVALATLVALAACDQGGPDPAPADPLMLTSGPCGGYAPSSGDIAVDSQQSFVRQDITIPCDWRYGEITPANGTAGFTQGTACGLTATTGNLVFKVRGCEAGEVTLKIYTDSTKTTLLQTIPISVGLL